MNKGIKGENSKKYLIEIAAKLFLQKGYSNTGINDILTEAGVSKGSFYFHFSSKKDLAVEVSKYYYKIIVQNWLKPLSNNTWDVFINKLVLDIKNSTSLGKFFGCPIAILGLEIAFIEEDLSDMYAYSIKELIEVFKNSLKVSEVSEDKLDSIARKAFSIYEGYTVYYRITKDKNVIDFMLKDLLEIQLHNNISMNLT
ncbi:TetR/AcrR family transcriptional regulator [Clostridium pasteurianum]|uniref:Transcriptional regulator n=1 Tax=Clostridium pasteurianum BC1 TaxID=86416 RepID=R4KEN9_CLOPA|nr:TetR/AcrR family transcriptional regulator [Clostridium pasteurianum]AGK98075.1 transcriptional regulator [Clostridium pasteurianum BC1]